MEGSAASFDSLGYDRFSLGYAEFIEAVGLSGPQVVRTPTTAPSKGRMEVKALPLEEEWVLVDEYISQNDTDSQNHARHVRAVTQHRAWAVFQQGYAKFANVWKRKLVGRSIALLRGGVGMAGGYLTYQFMVQRAAANAASSGNAVAGSAEAPNTNLLRYAGAAGLLANSLAIVASLPNTVIAVISIVSSIKTGIRLKQAITENKAKLAEVRAQYKTTPTQELAAQEMKLLGTITTDRTKLAELPVAGILMVSGGILSAINTVRGALGIATIALQASQGSLTTLGTLAQVSSVLGPFSAALGLALGGIGLAVSVRQALKIYRETQAVMQRMDELDEKLADAAVSDTVKKLMRLEKNVLLNKKLQLKDDLRHTLITFASNLVLTAAGVLGLLSAVGVVTGPGALVMGGTALLLTGISAGISVGHYFYRKHTQEVLAGQMRPQQMASEAIDLAIEEVKAAITALSDDDLQPFLPAWTTDEQRADMIQRFRSHPEVYLKDHFSVLILPEEKKAA